MLPRRNAGNRRRSLNVKQIIETAAPTALDQPSAAMAFALLLETACEQFEVMQAFIKGEIKITEDSTVDIRSTIKFARASACVRAALAKSFVANIIRARRICEYGAGFLTVGRADRKLFLKMTIGISHIRDVNEHGFDVKDSKSRPALHFNGGGFLDETSLDIQSAERVLMGPLNLYDVYRTTARMRDLAGFASLKAPRT